MSKTKGVGFMFLRKLFLQKGRAVEQALLEKLSPEEIKMYHETLPMSWVDIEMLTRIFSLAAPLLFPDSPNPLRDFARAEAKDALSGIYRIFLRFSTVPILVEQTAKLWNLYYEKGKARPEKEKDKNCARLIVEDYPDLPEKNFEIIAGYTIGTLELTGAKNVQCQIDDRNPQRWVWTFSWE